MVSFRTLRKRERGKEIELVRNPIMTAHFSLGLSLPHITAFISAIGMSIFFLLAAAAAFILAGHIREQMINTSKMVLTAL
jgi:hypothetical protein